MLDKALSQHTVDDNTLNVDIAERRTEEPETGDQSPAKDAKRQRLLKRAVMLIQELQKLEPLLQEELKTIECSKPERKRRALKQQRYEMYQRKYGF